VRVADLASPLRRPLREGDRTALIAAGGAKIRTAGRGAPGRGGCRPASMPLITPGSG
jgi:hypothetical protein